MTRPVPAGGRRRAAAALVVGAALGLCGCGGDGHARPTPTASPRPTGTAAPQVGGDRPPSVDQQLQELLDRRAAALAGGDPDAYAATSAPGSRARDRRAARDAARIGLREVRLELRRARVHGERARLRAIAGWAVRGIRGTFRAERTLRAVLTRRGWRMAGAVGERARPPWEVASYRRREEPHFVVLAPAGLDVAAADLPAALAGGYRRIAAALPRTPLRRRYLAVVAVDAATARALTSQISGLSGLAALADTAVRQTGPAQRVKRVYSQRLLVVWPAFAALPADQRRRVIAHELTHLVLAGSTSGRTPSWLVEGIALYVSGDDREAEAGATLRGAAGEDATRALDLRRLSAPKAIARMSGREQAAAYAYASAAAFAIARRHGRRALLRLYDTFGDPELRGHAGAELTDRAMRRALGVGLGAFERRLRASLS